MKVLVINQWATNKGDRAVLYFLLRELARNGVRSVTVSTSDPSYWRERPDFPEGIVPVCIQSGWNFSTGRSLGFVGKVLRAVKVRLYRKVSWPIVRRALISGSGTALLPLICDRRYLQAIKGADLVLSTGGHRVTTINQPDALGPQIFDMAVALLCGKPLVLWSQSIGPFTFRDPLNRSMIQAILRGAARILVRNENSCDEIRGLGIGLDRVGMTQESVLGLHDIVKERMPASKRPAVLGISIYATNRRTPESYREYVQCLAGVVNHALANGYERVQFFPMELEGADRPCIDAVIGAVDHKERCTVLEGFPGTADHINAIARCRMFMGHKTHSVIFSLAAGTPLLAIAYHKKTEDFMAQFGLQEYCISDKELTRETLIGMFDRLNARLDDVAESEYQTAAMLCEKVKRDFADMIEAARSGWADPVLQK